MFSSLSSFDVFIHLPLGITALEGDDARLFLQGQLTCNIDDLTPTHSQLAAHCDAKGKVLAALRLIDTGTNILAIQDVKNTVSHLPQLAKYAVFSRVTITDDTTQYICTGLAGEDVQSWLTQHVSLDATSDNNATNTDFGSLICVDNAELSPRYLFISTVQQHTALLTALTTAPHKIQPNELWNALNCRAGLAIIQPNTQAEFVPQMLNLQMLNAISFKKGCYIGQETVARMHFRGLNKRAMLVLQSSSHIECKVGDSVEKQLGDSWRNAGTIINVEHLSKQTIACAVLPSDFELDGLLRVKGIEGLYFNASKPTYFEET